MKPLANYMPFIISGNLLYISGQLPMQDNLLKYRGKLGENITDEDGIKAAALCAENLISQAKLALSDLNKIKQCVKLTGFVNAVPDYTNHPKIIDGASDYVRSILDDRGVHARAAVGVSSLPLGSPVEVEAIFELYLS